MQSITNVWGPSPSFLEVADPAVYHREDVGMVRNCSQIVVCKWGPKIGAAWMFSCCSVVMLGWEDNQSGGLDAGAAPRLWDVKELDSSPPPSDFSSAKFCQLLLFWQC